MALNQAGKWPADADSAEAATLALTQIGGTKSALEPNPLPDRRRACLSMPRKLRIEAEIARLCGGRAPAGGQGPAGTGAGRRVRWQSARMAVRYHLRRLEWTEALAFLDGMSATGNQVELALHPGSYYSSCWIGPKRPKPTSAAATEAISTLSGSRSHRRTLRHLPSRWSARRRPGAEVLALGGVRRALEWAALARSIGPARNGSGSCRVGWIRNGAGKPV